MVDGPHCRTTIFHLFITMKVFLQPILKTRGDVLIFSGFSFELVDMRPRNGLLYLSLLRVNFFAKVMAPRLT